MAKILKVSKTEDIAQLIQKVKNMREHEAVIEIETGSPILSNSANLRLVRKTAEVLGKAVELKTTDAIGKVLAVKAGMPLYGNETIEIQKPQSRVKRMPAKHSGFSDMRSTRKVRPQVEDEEPEPVAVKSSWQKGFTRTAPTALKRPTLKPGFPAVTMPQAQAQAKKPWIRWRLGSNFSKLLTLGAVILVVAVFGLAVLLPQAQVTVYARSEPVTRDVEITVDKNARVADSAKQVIPGEIIVKEVSDTKNFQTTGTKLIGEKATGSVVIYNFTKNTLTLKASTTTLLVNGRKYFFTKDATGIRPTATIGQGDEAEVDQSSLTPPVAIVAENPGENYNMNANQKFELKNAALGTNQNVYAVNEAAITGGSAKTVNILAQADLDRATAQMTEDLASIAEQELANDNSGSTKKVLPSGSTKEILAKTADKNVGDEATDFDMTVIGRLTGLSYDEDHVKNVVVEKINFVLSEDKYLLEEGKKEVSARYKSIDLAAGLGVLSVHFETIAAYRVNSDNLSKVLAGKSAPEIKEILLTRPEIDRVDVRFSPFFVNKAPRYNGKIFVKTVLSQN